MSKNASNVYKWLISIIVIVFLQGQNLTKLNFKIDSVNKIIDENKSKILKINNKSKLL